MLPAYGSGMTYYSSADHKQYKDISTQTVKSGNKWHDLTFDGKARTLQGNGKRSIFCMQVAVSMKGKPTVVRLRFARHLPNGTLDTTGTNTYTGLDVVKSTLYESPCWEFDSKYPVSAQIKISGKAKSYSVIERQFKMWTPNASYPTVGFPIPEATPTIP